MTEQNGLTPAAQQAVTDALAQQGSNGPASTPGDPSQQPAGQQAPAAQTPAPGDKGEGGEPKTFDEAYVRQLRTEAAGHRTGKKEAEEQLEAFKAGIAKALGIGEDPDPAKAAAEITAERDAAATAARAATQELAAYRAAARAGANADRLLDSRRFAAKLEALDPTDAGHDAAVEALIKDELRADPSLALNPAPSASGTHEHQGGANNDETSVDWFNRKFYTK